MKIAFRNRSANGVSRDVRPYRSLAGGRRRLKILPLQLADRAKQGAVANLTLTGQDLRERSAPDFMRSGRF